jgi:hypothetical protein
MKHDRAQRPPQASWAAVRIAPVTRAPDALRLQRKCACGRSASADHDECDACRAKSAGWMQMKRLVGGPDDALERQADDVAARVTRMPGWEPGAGHVGRSATLGVQRRSSGASSSKVEAPPIVDRVLGSPGVPLDGPTRAFFEPRFGHDFSRVRLHSDAAAAASADAVDARAYTVGQHIVFGRGQFEPGGAAGRTLIAHELTHTIQQRGLAGAHAALARKPKAAAGAGEELEILEAPASTDPSDQPWFVYYDPAIKKDRRILLPTGTRVESIGKVMVDVRTAPSGEKQRVALRPVRVVTVPGKGSPAHDVVGRQGMVPVKFLKSLGTKPAGPRKPSRYSRKKLKARQAAALKALALRRAQARLEYERSRPAVAQSHLQVRRGPLGTYGGAAQATAQVIAEPVKEEILAAQEAVEEVIKEIESSPLYAFGEGVIEGARANLKTEVFADNIDTFAKFALMWHVNPALQIAFAAGTLTGVKKEIEGLIDLIRNFDEVKDQFIELAKIMVSEGGAEVTRPMGYQIGSEWAKRMTEIAGITDLTKLATALGETFGPLLLEIAIGIATGGGSAAASISARVSSLLAKFPKLAKLLDKLKGVRKVLPGRGKGAPDVPSGPKKAAGEGVGPSKRPSAKRLPDADLEELRGLAKDPDNIKRLTGDKGYDLEVSGGDHSYRRAKDGTWCRFSKKECDFVIDPEIEEMIERGIRPEPVPQGRARPRRPKKIKAKGFTERARKAFEKVRDKHAKRLGVASGEDVHHAIELQVLDRYPGAFKQNDLNAFENMRGIPAELQRKKQFHNSKLREVWDRHYAELDDDIARRGLQEGTEAYRQLVTSHIETGRKEIDHLYDIFFAEVKRGKVAPGAAR